MFTQCPQCGAVFQLSASQLKAANGDVRCGQCLSVFNALDHLSEDLPHNQAQEDTAEQAYQTEQELDWSEPTTDAPTPVDTVTTEPLEAATETEESNDVFNELIAKASAHNIPAEEIERFEEFLATDNDPASTSPTTEDLTTADELLSTESSLSAEDALPTDSSLPVEDFSPVEDSSLAENSLPTEQAEPHESETVFSTEETYPTETLPPIDISQTETSPKPEISLDTDATETVTFTAADLEAGETSLGDVDNVTADLDIQISNNDEEFAELNAYLNDDTDTVGTDKPARAAEASEEQIIIESADLEPLNSPDYADTPNTEQQSSTTTDVTETAAENLTDKKSTVATSDGETINIPSLILDDLHAAKAEQLRPSNTPWIVGSLLLMLALVLQVVYHSRDDLARDASLRPWLIQMCDVIGCTLSQPYDVKQIEIIGRDVRSHPTARKALIVSTTLINNASFVQPYPLLTMVFSDINGTKIAQRRFIPREYLDNNIDLEAGMTPDMPVRIELELVDPGKNAVNYEFIPEVDPRQTRPLS